MQYNKSVKCNKKAYFAPLPPKSSHFFRSSPSLSTHTLRSLPKHCQQHRSSLSKKENKTEYLAAPIVEGDG